MIRCLTIASLLLVCSPLAAQDWARKMFEEREHNFGIVARGSKAEHAFVFKNLYKEDIHIAGVRSSCGCTTPKVTKRTLKTHDTSSVIAVYNTRSFLGKKSATITVTIDKPFYAEVQLTVRGFIRSDVVIDPGVISFGDIEQGKLTSRRVKINYAGRKNWRIVDVRSAKTFFEVELDEVSRGQGRIEYGMKVGLKKDTPPGYLQAQLTIVTDDSRRRTIVLPVEGRVVSPLTVTPQTLFLGEFQTGEKVTKKLVVRGKKPFTITKIDCGDDCFEFKPSSAKKKLHFVPVTFVAGEKTGKLRHEIRIQTDVGTTQCTATARVRTKEKKDG